jgi:hypothetical protein
LSVILPAGAPAPTAAAVDARPSLAAAPSLMPPAERELN